MSFNDLDASIECSRASFTLPLGDDTNYALNTSDTMDNCPVTPSDFTIQNNANGNPRHHRTSIEFGERLDDIIGPPSLHDSFNYTAFLEGYERDDDSLLRRAEISDDEAEGDLQSIHKSIAGCVEQQFGKDPAQIITEVKCAIEKKDGQVQLLISKLEELTREKEEQEKECLELRQKVVKLEEDLRDAAEALAYDHNEFGPAEMSSYLHLPQNFKTPSNNNSEGQERQPMTNTQEVQTSIPVSTHATLPCRELIPTMIENSTQFQLSFLSTVASTQTPIRTVSDAASQAQEAKKTFSDAATQSKTVAVNDAKCQVTLLDETMRTRYKILQENAAALKSDLETLRKTASENQVPFDTTKLLRSIAAIEETTREEVCVLKEVHAQELKNWMERNEEVKKNLDEAQEVLRGKEEEIIELKVRVAQLEFSNSRKVSEQKLISFSSRMSPEGSELDVDNISLLSDSTSHGKVTGKVTLPEVSIPEEEPSKSEHYEITRTKKEYLWLTPSVEIGNEPQTNQISTTGSPGTPNSVLEDLRLQLGDLEKKFTANLRYLEEQTAEREFERDEFHRESKEYQRKLQELQRERDRLQDLSEHQRLELEEMEQRLTEESARFESEVVVKTEKLETDLKNSIDKIYELRGVIRDLEEHIDLSTANVGELREANEILREELEKLIREKVEETLLKDSNDTLFLTANSEWTQDELLSQVQDLADRLAKKLTDLENYKWSAPMSRPGSGSSNSSSQTSVGSEDVSVRDIVQAASGVPRDQELTAQELLQGIRRLDVHFENFVKFEEIMMKKLRDTEIRLGQTMKRQTELELEKVACQEQLKEQLLRVSDLERLLDQRRFEPSPNSLTMSDLRTRIKGLTEELEEVKGQALLKTIELEDLKEKMAASAAMRTNHGGSLNMSGRNNSTTTPVLKLSMTTQTLGPISRNRLTQTVPMSVLVDGATQTVLSLQFPSDMDLSSITGAPAPFHSTPTDPPISANKNSKLGERRSPLFSSLLLGSGTAEGELPPEALRRELPHSSIAHDEFDDLRLHHLPNVSMQKRIAITGAGSINTNGLLPPSATSNDTPNTTAEHSGELTLENGTVLAPPFDTGPRVVSQSTETSILQEIQKLRTENRLLETKLSALTVQDSSSAHPRGPPPCYDSQIPLKLGSSNRGKQASSENLEAFSAQPSPQSKGLVKNPDLEDRITVLEKEKSELEWHVQACQTETSTLKCALEEERAKFAAARAGVEKLGPEREEMGRKLKELEESCALRTFQIEKLQIQFSAERKSLESEIERLRIQLDSEVNDRRAVQESFDVAKHHLQRHLATDKCLREENLRLIGELGTLRDLGFAQAAEIDALAQNRVQSHAHPQVIEGSTHSRPNYSHRLEHPRGESIKGLPLIGGGSIQNTENLELYLRAKSYRKALTWQKKYLILVIQGYKDLLDQSGVGVPYPQLLQDEIPLTPTSLGLIDLTSPSTRFKICAKAVLATIRMKFMVRRWEGRNRLNRPLLDHVNENGRRRSSNLSTNMRKGSGHGVPWRNMGVVPGLTLSSLSTATATAGQGDPEVETVLSDYLRRIQSLESEVEGVFKKNNQRGHVS